MNRFSKLPALGTVLLFLLSGGTGAAWAVDANVSARALTDLSHWLARSPSDRPPLAAAAFASAPLTKPDAAAALNALWQDRVRLIRSTRADEMRDQEIKLDGLTMQFKWLSFGDSNNIPAGGRSLLISMHGGGGAPKAVNDEQWTNQLKLGYKYHPDEGIYVVPRAPTDAWNMWHQADIDDFFARLIGDFVVFEHVNPNRVYLMGYSAGGDGVYQLAPRMADRWAAAAMSAGHPNDASPLGLRNVPFAIQVGANDAAYHRNEVAAAWGEKLDALERADPQGYAHFTKLYAGKGHWMDMEDRIAIPWMEKFTRDPLPQKVVWFQNEVTHPRFYWLARPENEVAAGQELVAERSGQVITLAATNVRTVTVLLNDAMLNLDEPVVVRANGQTLFSNRVDRTVTELAKTLAADGDTNLAFSAVVTVTLPNSSWWSAAVQSAVQSGGTNRTELVKALQMVPVAQREGMTFLIANMPPPDLKTLSADFLLANTALAYEALAQAPWGKQIPPEIFLNDILPYAVVTEPRDDWRAKMRERCLPLVRGCRTPGEAALALNRELFGLVKVKYSPERERADQSVPETLQSGLASCTGLTILLVDACRSVGVPARLAGTPMWMNGSGNHSWAEIWDHGWHFVGAAEPDQAGLDHAWFVDRAEQARADEPEHAIYAASFAKTGLDFPPAWSTNQIWVSAVNVTARYAKPGETVKGTVRLLVKVVNAQGRRIKAAVTAFDPANPGKKLTGESRDESADLNNVLTFDWPAGTVCEIKVDYHGRQSQQTVAVEKPGEQTVVFQLAE